MRLADGDSRLVHVNTHARVRRTSNSVVAIDRHTLLQCIVLSMLLHLWIIVLFGTTTYSGARRDRDFGDSLSVTLRALIEERGSSFRLAPGAETVLPGTALLPRPGRTAPALRSRDQARPPEATASSPSTDASMRESAPPTPQEALPPATAAPPMPSPPAEPLPRLNLDAPEVVDKPYVPPAPTPIEREIAPPTPAVPRDITPPPVPAERIVPPTIEREIAPPPEAKPRAVPIAPAITPERAPAPKIEAESAPPIATPPRIAPPEPVARPEPVAPSVKRDVAPPAAPITPASTPAQRSVPNDIAPRPAERSAPDKIPEARPSPRTDAAPAESPPRLRFGAPEPDEDMFKPRRDVVTPPAEPGAAPRLDLDGARQRAVRAVVREGSGSRGLISIVPPPPEHDSKDARALEKAAKPDCRTAYANMGLLAAVPLVASAIGESGCRW